MAILKVAFNRIKNNPPLLADAQRGYVEIDCPKVTGGRLFHGGHGEVDGRSVRWTEFAESTRWDSVCGDYVYCEGEISHDGKKVENGREIGRR